MSSFLNIKYRRLAFVILILNHIIRTTALQTTQEIAIAECASFKHQAYDSVYTYSAFVSDQDNLTTVVDNCQTLLPFIIGGSPAKPKEFPHMARLGFAQKTAGITDWFCGGVLVSHKFVLTAAHCFHAPNGILNRVRLGELVFNSETDDAHPEDFDVIRLIPHPAYKVDQLYNDIGLVELLTSANLSEYIAPACLPSTSGNDFNRFIAVGWGATRFARSHSDVLLKVILNRHDTDRCDQFIDDNFNFPFGLNKKSQFCAGSTKQKDTCHGDSGGPLLLVHNEFPCMYFVVGITSTGFGCGFANIPGIYTNVSYYLRWIEEVIWHQKYIKS